MKQLQEIRDVLPSGYTLVRLTRSGHWAIIRPDGQKLRLPSGTPIHIAHSASDHRTRKNEIRKIRSALEADGS